jgi:hypothetical protein
LSVHERGWAEAQRYKWIESEEAGRDLGEGAIHRWFRDHWNGFLRDRWIEHLEGRTFWIELDRGDFGLLQRELRDSTLADEILRRLKAGGENLDILCWAHDRKLPRDKVREFLDLLETLDINSHRLESQFKSHLS